MKKLNFFSLTFISSLSCLLFFSFSVSAQTELNLSLFNEFTGEAADDSAGISVSSAGDVNGDGFDDILVGASDAGSYAGAAYLIYGSSALLTSVSLSTAVEFTGEAAINYAGISVSSAGDVNNDGYDDILVGASEAGSSAGAAYLIYGSSAPLTSASLSTAVKFTGEAAGDYAGISVSSAGDVNNDGYDDILVGAFDTGGGGEIGSAYLIYGSSAPLTSASLSTAVEFTGEAAIDYAGISVSSAGDVNNDGYNDILIGAYGNDDGGSDAGAAYLIYGSSTTLTPASLSTAVEFTGEAANDSAGMSVSSARDVNGDGYDDILVGAHLNNDGGSDAGAAYLIYGQASEYSGTISLGTSGIAEFTGEAASDYAGMSVSSARDINGDGYDDILVGAHLNNDGGSDAGAAYLIYGSSTPLTSASLSTAVEFTGEAAGDYAGMSVSSAGDVNGDSLDDILVGAYYNDDGGFNSGAAYLGYLYIDNDLDGIPGTDGLFDGADTNDNDHDNDGSETGTDCNDDDPTIHDYQTYYADADGDGYGVSTGTLICANSAPAGYVTNNTDCNDDDITVNENQTYYEDADGDGYGSTTTTSVCSSTPPTGYVANNTDCNDNDITVNTNQTYYQDADNDTLGNLDQTTSVCSSTPSSGYVINTLDTDDTKTDILLQYETDSDYYLVLRSTGKKLSLVNLNANEILNIITLSKNKKYSKNTLKLKTIRNKDTAVVISKKKSKVLLSLIKINITEETLKIKDNKKITNENIKTSKTKIKKNTIYLKNKSAKTLLKYLVTKKFILKLK